MAVKTVKFSQQIFDTFSNISLAREYLVAGDHSGNVTVNDLRKSTDTHFKIQILPVGVPATLVSAALLPRDEGLLVCATSGSG